MLSPMLFLMVMDSVLTILQNENAGISINGMYVGSFGHADDLRSVSPSLVGIQKQASIVKSFTEMNGLKLNTEKLELLAMCDGNCPQDCTIQFRSMPSHLQVVQNASV